MQLRLQSFMAQLFACKNTATTPKEQKKNNHEKDPQQLNGNPGTTNN